MRCTLFVLLMLSSLTASAQSSQPTTTPTSAPVIPPAPACGDHVLQGYEQCDDGDRVSGDGCSASCTKEFCGDGVRQITYEECDDGNRADRDGCSTACKLDGLHSPEKAQRLAIELTLAGYVVPLIGVPLIIVGPSAGHIYAGEKKKALRASTVRLAAAVTSVAAFFGVFTGGPGSVEGVEQVYVALVPIGVGVFLGSTIYSIVDAPKAVKRANAKALGEPLNRP